MNSFWETALLAPLVALGKDVLVLLPNVLAMLIILTVGWLSAWLLGAGMERVLRIIGVDRLSNRMGASAALLRFGVKTDPSALIGQITYWTVLGFSLIAALGALNLAPVNRFAESLLSYIPYLLTALMILMAGYLLSNFVGRAVLIGAVNAGLRPARAVAGFSRWGVQLVAIAMALEQMGIAEHIVVVGFGVTLGAVALAAAIALGLGAQDLAKEFLERRLSPKIPDKTQPDDLRHL